MEKTFGEIKKGDYIWKTSDLQDWTTPRKIRVLGVEDLGPTAFRIRISFIDRKSLRPIERFSKSRPRIEKTKIAPPRKRTSWDFYHSSEEAALRSLLDRNKVYVKDSLEVIDKIQKTILDEKERLSVYQDRIKILCQKLSNI